MVRILFAVAIFLIAAANSHAQKIPSDFGSPEDCGIYRYKATIVRVYDGDTVWADIDLGFNTWRKNEPIRLWGIDTPEVRGKERPEGLIVRDIVRERILDEDVFICTIKDDQGKFGRYLGIIWDKGENLNQWLLDNGHAVPYE